jgi:hypothetical protein
LPFQYAIPFVRFSTDTFWDDTASELKRMAEGSRSDVDTSEKSLSVDAVNHTDGENLTECDVVNVHKAIGVQSLHRQLLRHRLTDHFGAKRKQIAREMSYFCVDGWLAAQNHRR